MFDLQCHIPEVDGILERMRDPDPMLRPPAWEAMNRILEVIQATPPQALYYPPDIVHDWADDPAPTNTPLNTIPADAPPNSGPEDVA